MEIILRPLSGRGLDIRVEYDEKHIHIRWEKADFKIKNAIMRDIKINFSNLKTNGIH